MSRAVSDFLRHLAAHDLPDGELFRLKAEAFEAMAAQFTVNGDRASADECQSTAAVARTRAGSAS